MTGGVVAGGKITRGQNSSMINTSFSRNVGDGLMLDDVMTTTLTFITSFFRENGGKGISGVTSDVYFLRCTFENNVGKSIHLSEVKKLLKFESCYWEANEMPNGVHIQIENGEAQFYNCDFGSTQIVIPARLINSNVEFINCKHTGQPNTVPVNFDDDSKLVLINSFEEYPISTKAIIPQFKNEIRGYVDWLLSDSPSIINVPLGKTLHVYDYHVELSTNCTELITVTFDGRTSSSFDIHIHEKPTGANARIYWRVEY